ncbi:hypothetical protein Enr10x_61160 [Gimesia panareensis]|uniref:DNA ligase (ATP) n=1 Tax=Gimesia panareensis TaxID=2527978 RepID=A0A517QGI0_9PLAN|nr:hypothetical protein [Gimesia panareensis]QDT30748.1 hypothetical protein Enr10x_61160 [Gimesia panareensis]
MNSQQNQLVQEPQSSQSQPTCSECGTHEPWGLSSWCPKCGYYPALGKCVGQPEPQADEEEKPQPQTIWELIPEWGWILGLGVIGSIGLSIAGRFLTQNPAELCLWTLTQATAGFLMLVIGQFIAYLYAVSKSVEFGILSIILNPFKIWRPTIARFPEGAWKLDMTVWGLTLTVGAFAIVGGFEFNSLFDDWGVRKTANVNLVSSIVDQAKQHEGDGAEDLEGALNDFAGGTEEEMKEKLPEEEGVTGKLPEFDCLVVGYTTLPDGRINSVLLASSFNKRLVYAGKLNATDIPAEVLEEWQQRLPGLEQFAPFVKVNADGATTWIKPQITVNVASKGWAETNQQLVKPKFVSLLQEISVNQ